MTTFGQKYYEAGGDKLLDPVFAAFERSLDNEIEHGRVSFVHVEVHANDLTRATAEYIRKYPPSEDEIRERLNLKDSTAVTLKAFIKEYDDTPPRIYATLTLSTKA